MPRAAVYARVSDPDDTRETSLDIQARDAREHALKLGYTCDPAADSYQDRYTGTELYDRPGLSALREQVRAGRYQLIVVRSLDRLGREPAHWAILFDEAERNGCKIFSATEEIDSTPEGELIRNIRGYLAKTERIKIADRTQSAVKAILGKGKSICSGVARFGYKYDKDNRTRSVVDPEADVVRRIFSLAIEGYSIRKIASLLNSEGVPSPGASRGRKYKDGRTCHWGKDTVGKILGDTSYYGDPQRWGKTRVTGKRDPRTGRSLVKPVPIDEVKELKDPTPPILTREIFEAAHGRTASRKTDTQEKTARSRNKENFRLLRGMVFCRVCGRTMTTQSIAKWKRKDGSNQGERYHYYICISGAGDKPDDKKCGNGRTQIHAVEAEAWRQVAEMLEDRDKLKERVESVMCPDPSLDADLAVHRGEISNAEKKIKRLIDRLGDDDDEFIVETLKGKIAEQKKLIEDHRSAMEKLQERIADREAVREAIEDLDHLIAQPTEILEQIATATLHGEPIPVRDYLIALRKQALSDYSPEQKRQILIALGVKVYVARTTVRVECSITIGESSPLCCRNKDKSPVVFTFSLTG